MESQTGTYKGIEKLIEISSLVIIASGLAIVHLPITPKPDIGVIYAAALFTLVFAFAWHRLRLPISEAAKNFMESLVFLLVIAIVVHVTGGAGSYFNFLYLLPNLNTATTATRWQTFVSWFVTAIFIAGEFVMYPQLPQQAGGVILPSFGLVVFNIWAVGLSTVYGRYLAKEAETAQIATTEATVEKEKEINKLKDEFLFIVAHELRGPITAIRGYLELFLNSDVIKRESGVWSIANVAFLESERLNDLIGELLDLSRLEVGKLKLQNEVFDVNQFLAQILESEFEQAKEKKIQFTLKPPGEGLMIYADKERVREVILNLVDNAIKYTAESGKVWVWVERGSQGALISVADTGVGIYPKDLPHIFDRFHTDITPATPTETKKEKSIGLGLFLAKQLVEKMGGAIYAESRVGQGSKFTFSLPLAKS